MTPLEIIFTIILWIITGLWVAYKREWCQYEEYQMLPTELVCVMCVIFAPIVFVTAFVRVFLIGKWK